jgi:hypothetical protein
MYRVTITHQGKITSRYTESNRSLACLSAGLDLNVFDTMALVHQTFPTGMVRIEATNSLHDAPVAVATIVKVPS